MTNDMQAGFPMTQPRLVPVLLAMWLGLVAVFALLFGVSEARAQTPAIPTGIVELAAAHSNLCLAVSGDSSGNGVTLQQSACGSPYAKWTFEPESDGTVLLRNVGSLKCLDRTWATENGVRLTQWDCHVGVQNDHSENNQRLRLETSSGNLRLRNPVSNRCIDVMWGDRSVGARVIQWDCHGGPNQQWVARAPSYAPPVAAIPAPPTGPRQLVAGNSGLCLGVVGGSMQDDAVVEQARCDGDTSRVWEFRPVGGNVYALVNKRSSKCLGSTLNADRLVQMTQTSCNPNFRQFQQFTLDMREGRYVLQSGFSGRCMDVQGWSTAIGGRVIQWDCHKAANQQWAVQQPSSANGQFSSWSPVIQLPVVATSAAHLKNGRVMLWAANWRNGFAGTSGTVTYTSIFDPTDNSASDIVVTDLGQEIFCEATSLTSDGTVLVSGGSALGSTFAYSGTSWSKVATLNKARGYNSSVTTNTGRVFTLGGSWSGGEGGKGGEVWEATKGWKALSGVPVDDFLTNDAQGANRSDNHMWLLAGGGDWVFHAGPSRKMHWINTSGDGSVVSAGTRGSDDDAITGNAVMFDLGKILTVGGSTSYVKGQASKAAHIIDISKGPGVTPTVTRLTGLKYERAFANSVVLPTGEVVVIGGNGGTPEPFSDDNSVMTPELFNPTTGLFTPLKPMTVPRNYHSTALLLLDGRVLAAGGGLCGDGCNTNHKDAEILSPPYLFDADGREAKRPVISDVPTSARAGDQITLRGEGVASYAMVRMAAVTHSTNTDQRRVPLLIGTRRPGGTDFVRIPERDRGVPPGNYMLFGLSDTGTPSLAKVITIN